MNMGETSTGEMSFQKILNIENYHTSFNVTTAQAANTELWREAVTPMMLPTVTGLGTPPNVEVHDYISHVSQPFSLWRGLIKFNFRAVKTIFHSVRLRVGWSPTTAANSVIDRDACYIEIVDLKDRNQWDFEVPYVYPLSWLNTKTSGSLPTFCGVIFVDVENQMVAPDTVADTIEIIVERSAGEGYELNLPTVLDKFPIDSRMTETTRVTKPPAAAAQDQPVAVAERPPVKHPNPYQTPVEQEEERFDLPAYNIVKDDLSYFSKLPESHTKEAKKMLRAGTQLSSTVLTIINDMAIYGQNPVKDYLSLTAPQLIEMFENNGGEKDFYTQLPGNMVMRKRDVLITNVCVPMEGGGCAPVRDMSTLDNHSSGPGCEKFDQDVMRNIARSETFTRPPPALQADNYTLGSSINDVKTMIMRSTRFVINGKPTPTRPLHIQPHAYAPMAFIAGAPGAYVRPAMDNLSYFAALYTFARGGVGIRMITGEERYKYIVDPSLILNLTTSTKLTPAQIAAADWTGTDTELSSNDIVHAINPAVEGFGEITIPFYSQTYCQAYDMNVSSNPFVDNSQLQQPKTHLVVYPYSTPDNGWQGFRHACADFEFSMLSGAPVMVAVNVADPTS